MRNASSTITLGKVLWATLLACCLQATLVVVAVDPANTKSGHDNLQIGDVMPRGSWSPQIGLEYPDRLKRSASLQEEPQEDGRQWGKLHGEWSLKRSTDPIGYYTPVVDKKAWQSLQGGWGKRFSPSEDDLAIQELASILEQENNIPPMESNDFEIHQDEKRNWNKFSDGWGKRNKWEKFRGSWGKREPAWSNLKGIWGKRSVQDQFAN